MVKPKPKSKRTTVALRHKIEKASLSKQRKQRKLAKSNPEWRSRLKKDPGIPNLFPYKDKLLHEIEEKKRLKEEEAVRKRGEAKARRDGVAETMEEDTKVNPEAGSEEEELLDDEEMDEDVEEDDSNPMAALLASARARAVEYDGDEDGGNADEMDEDDSDSNDNDNLPPITDASIPVAPSRPETSRRAFDKVFKAVTSSADVILYVLDARDPEGTRSKEVERQIMAAEGGSKRLILILNKIDLIPGPVLKAWLVHLRRYFPTLPLRASNPAPNARTFDHKHLTVKATSETLFRALKSYAHAKQLKRAITVGVIGYPNVGKSSVINALSSRLGNHSSTACPVGAEAGVTTAMREVKLDNKLKLLDSPGIVFPSTSTSTPSSAPGHPTSNKNSAKSTAQHQAHLILLNALPPKQIADPLPAITLLLTRLSASPALFTKLLDLYGLPPLMTTTTTDTDTDMTTDFLVQVARKRGRLGKGGVPNLHGAAMGVLGDWRDGRVQGWVEAPVLEVQVEVDGVGGGKGKEEGTGGGDRKEIVREWSREFRIEGLWGDGGDAKAGEEEAMRE